MDDFQGILPDLFDVSCSASSKLQFCPGVTAMTQRHDSLLDLTRILGESFFNSLKGHFCWNLDSLQRKTQEMKRIDVSGPYHSELRHQRCCWCPPSFPRLGEVLVVECRFLKIKYEIIWVKNDFIPDGTIGHMDTCLTKPFDICNGWRQNLANLSRPPGF